MSGAVSGALQGLSYLSHQQPVLHYLPWLPLCLASSPWFSLTMKASPCWWELSCLSFTAAVCLCMLLVPLLLLQSFMVLLHRNQGTCVLIPSCYWYSLRNIAPDWPDFFFQIHSVNLKVTTLSSSSAFLFDNRGSRMKQCDYLPDAEHKLTANRHVIITSFRLWKNALGMLLIFNKQWDKLLFSDCPDISSSWLPLYSTSFEMLMLSSPFSIQKWKFLPCGLGLRRKMDIFWDGSTFKSLVGFVYPLFLFNSFLKTVILISLEIWTSWWAPIFVQLPSLWILNCSAKEVTCGWCSSPGFAATVTFIEQLFKKCFLK